MRIKVILACTKCNQRNYKTTKNEALKNERLEAKKFCKHCHEHTLHKETK